MVRIKLGVTLSSSCLSPLDIGPMSSPPVSQQVLLHKTVQYLQLNGLLLSSLYKPSLVVESYNVLLYVMCELQIEKHIAVFI